jgi:hypothetical protein
MKTATSSGCGCGGAARSVGPLVPTRVKSGDCGCGGSGCSCSGITGASSCDSQLGFLRPHFFPGQLLTEDDLGGLVDYVTQKQKLHNRMLFGDGIVCGLEVDCDPCGGGKVTVGAGYALDCCGNDIVVPCPVQVDINAMVRQLQRKLGVDCGDPCPTPGKKKCPQPLDTPDDGNADAAQPSESLVRGKGNLPAKTGPADLSRTYCLYLRYAEEQVDPVAPYTTDTACGDAACQFSRVREGYRFDLRCLADHPAQTDMLQAFIDCLGSLAQSDAPLDLLATLEERHQTYSRALSKLASSDPYVPYDPGVLTDPQSETTYEKALRLEKALAMYIGAIRSQTHAEALGALKAKIQMLSTDLPNQYDQLKIPLQRHVATGIVSAANKWMEPGQFEQAARVDGPPFEFQLLGAGAAIGGVVYSQFARGISDLRQRLYTAASAGGTDCTLLKAIAAIPVPTTGGTDVIQSDAQQLSTALGTLNDALVRYVKDCACRSILVRCAPCDDPAVLLACLDVDGCEVTSICNLVRRFVLSPAAARYWLGPLFDLGGDVLEAFCCGICPDIKTITQPTRGRFEERIGGIASLAALRRPLENVAMMIAIRAQEPGLRGLTGLLAKRALESSGFHFPKVLVEVPEGTQPAKAATPPPTTTEVERRRPPGKRPRPRGGGNG